jgi:hypothetical protein
MEQIEGRVSTFIPAQSELTDIEIRRDYGALIESAVSAFQYDPSYLIDMAEHASLIAYKRALWEVRMEVQRQEGFAKQSMIDELLIARGIRPPAKLSRGSRRRPKEAA